MSKVTCWMQAVVSARWAVSYLLRRFSTALVGKLFAGRGDPVRDAACSEFYAVINFGGLVATLLVGRLGVTFG
ncbi:hypothetical protein [Streptomyces violascens]|uniref:hypothetical protein n=1 Tax=Streptomyces violascens TaxID=67381 RepID=UPI003650D419